MKRTWIRLARNSARAFFAALAAGSLVAAWPAPASAAKRRLQVDDLFALQSVGDPAISPDGEWVAYTLEQIDAARDERETSVWMVWRAGGDPMRLTRAGANAFPPAEASSRVLMGIAIRSSSTGASWARW